MDGSLPPNIFIAFAGISWLSDGGRRDAPRLIFSASSAYHWGVTPYSSGKHLIEQVAARAATKTAGLILSLLPS